MKRPSLRGAINSMCKYCIYDPSARGNWREQVQACSSSNCPLHPLRPISLASRRKTTVKAPACGRHKLAASSAGKAAFLAPHCEYRDQDMPDGSALPPRSDGSLNV